jgi:hypothetical protein
MPKVNLPIGLKLREGDLNEVLGAWIQVVWNRRPELLFRKEETLELDSSEGHLTLCI